jgi:hypothetical protein
MKKPFNKVFAVLSAALFGVIIFTGCIKEKMLIKVKPDGSGNIVVSAMFNKSIVEAFEKQMKAELEKMGKDAPEMDPFYNVEGLKKAAKEFGDNVEYVKSKKVNNAKGRGYIAIYSFKNVSDLKLDIKKITSPMPNMAMQQPNPENCITFNLKKDGDISKLTVKVPQPTEEEIAEANKKPENITPTPMTDQEKQQMMMQGAMFGLTGNEKTKEEVIRKMFGGMAVDIDLEVDGKLVKTDASMKDSKKENRIKLLEVDYGKILKKDWLCTKITNDNKGDIFGHLSALKVDGVAIESKPEITLEFKAK